MRGCFILELDGIWFDTEIGFAFEQVNIDGGRQIFVGCAKNHKRLKCFSGFCCCFQWTQNDKRSKECEIFY